jgi:hypothetical protein
MAGQLVLLACYLGAGVAVSWPRATYLRGMLPNAQDARSYVWGFWWMARQITHLANPWRTGYLAAPAGVPLGFHALMPLPGAVMTPFTLAFGPAFSYNLLSVAMPGLLCYAMYRAARLWLPAVGAIAAGTLAGLVAAVVAAPQIVALAQQALSGGGAGPHVISYVKYGVGLPSLFAPSPRVMAFGLTSLGSIYHFDVWEATATFGTVLTVLAVAGLVVSWRRRSARLLALLFVGCATLALGPVMRLGSHAYVPAAVPWAGGRVSAIMPYTWFVHLPGMSGFREADRFTELGLAPAALLAGATVAWLRDHLRPLLVVVTALAVLEAGWSGVSRITIMPAAMPALDGPIAADHSRSIVVDVPFGVRGGIGKYGSPFPHQALVLATADGHPLAAGYVSRLPYATKAEIRAHPFTAIWPGRRSSTGSPRPSLRPPGRTPGPWMWAGCGCGRRAGSSCVTWPGAGSASTTGRMASRFTGRHICSGSARDNADRGSGPIAKQGVRPGSIRPGPRRARPARRAATGTAGARPR